MPTLEWDKKKIYINTHHNTPYTILVLYMQPNSPVIHISPGCVIVYTLSQHHIGDLSCLKQQHQPNTITSASSRYTSGGMEAKCMPSIDIKGYRQSIDWHFGTYLQVLIYQYMETKQ